MTYFRSLFLNFLIVFFVNRTIPGIEVEPYEGSSPDVVADVLFSTIIALLNASIFPALFILGFNPTLLKISIIAMIISFGGFYTVMFVNIGVSASTFGGVFLAGVIVSAISIFTNYLEKKHHNTNSKK
jgi:uncharacterized membrane protein YvlD (DUF360 family)